MSTINWTYYQSTGQLFLGNEEAGVCYSGNGPGLNNPALDHVHDVGPLPRGWYTIGAEETLPHLGPVVMHLDPDSTNTMYGRMGFFMHGDNADMDHSASDGCIIADRAIRTQVAASPVRRLEVVE
jgi:Protein of unknown function (DUF2778)